MSGGFGGGGKGGGMSGGYNGGGKGGGMSGGYSGGGKGGGKGPCPDAKIFVGGLPRNTTEHDVQAFFNGYGPVAHVIVMTDQVPSPHTLIILQPTHSSPSNFRTSGHSAEQRLRLRNFREHVVS
jgi:hypothetical protein